MRGSSALMEQATPGDDDGEHSQSVGAAAAAHREQYDARRVSWADLVFVPDPRTARETLELTMDRMASVPARPCCSAGLAAGCAGRGPPTVASHSLTPHPPPIPLSESLCISRPVRLSRRLSFSPSPLAGRSPLGPFGVRREDERRKGALGGGVSGDMRHAATCFWQA